MESSGRDEWVEYLLSRKFKERRSSKWLLTHPTRHMPALPSAHEYGVEDIVEVGMATYRKELEALPDDQLRRRGMEARIAELEGKLKSEQTKTVELEHENASLRAAVATRVTEEPLAIKERRTLLCIIGGLAKDNRLDLSKPYKAAAVVAKMMPDVQLTSHTIGNHLKQVHEAMDSRRS